VQPASANAESTHARVDMLERELGDFSYIVSHDLAATFRQIEGYLALLADNSGQALTPSQSAYADHIRTAADKCRAMLERLLDYSKAQQKVLDLAECDAGVLFDAARLQLAGAVRESEARICTGPLGRIRVDQELMTEAFRQALDNALKFRRPGMRPNITVKLAPAPTWAVRIIDDGPGVTAELQGKLFRMFHRLDPRSGLPGVGAGLATVRRILRRHGGDACMLDWTGGACVQLTLPAAANVAQ
jgi:two-component system, sensor histidine kinase and response regulator